MYRLFGRCEKALATGLEAPMSKTKLGAVLAGLGGLLVLTAKVINGDMDWATALPLALADIGSVLAIFGGRDAATKVIDAVNGK
jgi:hypothetical protein